MKASRQYAKMRRAQQPHVIFRDVKEPSASGPEVLARSLVSIVESVDSEQLFLTLEHARDWSDQPILCNGTQLPVIHAEGDGIWLSSDPGVQAGMAVSQVQVEGTFEALSREFLSSWKQRWQRHASVPSDRWDAVIAFAKQHLPCGQFQWPALDVPALQQIIRAKKSRTAGGPDGVSIADLKAMPKEVLKNFCFMYAQAEQSGNGQLRLFQGLSLHWLKLPPPPVP